MSAADNKADAKAAYEAFGRGDLDAALANVADDVVWTVSGNSTVSGVYKGREEVLKFPVVSASKGIAVVPQYFVAEDDRVVLVTRVTGPGIEADQAVVLTFDDDGKVSSFHSFDDTAQMEQLFGRR